MSMLLPSFMVYWVPAVTVHRRGRLNDGSCFNRGYLACLSGSCLDKQQRAVIRLTGACALPVQARQTSTRGQSKL